MNDIVQKPEHYTAMGFEVIDLINDICNAENNNTPNNGFNYYCIGNVIKYCMRYDNKNGIQDLEKAIKYIEFMEPLALFIAFNKLEFRDELSKYYKLLLKRDEFKAEVLLAITSKTDEELVSIIKNKIKELRGE